MRVIDSHTHIFSPELVREREQLAKKDRWFGLLYGDYRATMVGASQLVEQMATSGVDQSVAFGFAFADQGLCRLSNDYVLDAANKHPQQIIPLALVNPLAGARACREARRCLEQGARGIGELMPDGQGFALDEGDCLAGLMDLARSFDVPVLIHVNERVGHSYPGKGSQGPEAAYALAQRYPDNRLILAHWGAGLPFYELMPEVRQTLRHVYYDTAASLYLYEDRIFAQVMAWAPHKVLFGSDYPLITQSRFLRRIRRVGLDASDLERLLGANAQRLFSAPPPEES